MHYNPNERNNKNNPYSLVYALYSAEWFEDVAREREDDRRADRYAAKARGIRRRLAQWVDEIGLSESRGTIRRIYKTCAPLDERQWAIKRALERTGNAN